MYIIELGQHLTYDIEVSTYNKINHDWAMCQKHGFLIMARINDTTSLHNASCR